MSRLDAVLLAVCAVLLIAGGSYVAGQRHGKQQAALLQSQATADTIRSTITVAETVFVAKVDTFRVRQTKVVTLRDTLLRHVTDTVLVKQYVAASDTALRACSEVIVSCDTIRARYAALAKQDSTTQQLLRKQTPSLFDKIKQRCGLSVGYGVVSGKVDAVAGCNILP